MLLKKLNVLLSFILIAASAWTQQTVRGMVSDAKGAPLEGVTVAVKGQTTSTTTNPQGIFSIAAAQGNTLVFTYVGFQSREVVVGNQTNLVISLQESSGELSEVVVTGVGIATSKKRTSIDIASLSSKDVAKTAIQSIDQALVGKIAGAQIQQNSGEPGAAATIILRGLNTVGSTQPMILVDGIQVTDITGLDLANVERVEVAKGAAAGTLYGAQGANGVIQIFTKRGARNRKPAISISSRASFDQIIRNNDLVAQKHHFVTDAQGNLLDASGSLLKPDEFGAWPDPVEEDFNTNFDVVNDKEYKNIRLYDHFDQAFRRAFSHYTNLNVSGGGDRSDYSFTASLFNQQNVLNNEFRRINLSSNLGFDLFKGLTFRSVSQLVIGKEDLISGTYNLSRIVNIDPLFQASNNNRFLLVNTYPWVDFTFRNASGYLTLKPKAQENQLNPLSESEWHERFSKTNRFLQNFNLNYKFPKFVELDYKYGLELWNTDYNDYYKNPTGVPQASAAFWGSSPTGSIRADYVKTVFQNSLATLFFRTDFEQDFGLNVPIRTATQLSYDYRDYDYRSYFSKGSGLPSYPPLTIQSSSSKTSGDWYEAFRTHGVLFNQAIDFGDYGGITGGFRSDYSSEFGEAKEPFTFYRGTAYFRPSEFFKKPFLTDWKLRAAYGEAGVQPHEFNGDYYLRQQTLDVNALGGGVSLSFPVTAKNRALRVQKTRELEIGTDIGLRSNSQAWLNKVVLSGTWWTRRSDDIVQAAPIPLSTGASEIVDNLLKLKSNGLDISLDAGVLTTKNFDWQLGVRFGKSRSKVVDISNGQTFTSGVYALRPGDDLGIFYAVTPLHSLTQARPDKTPYIDPADAVHFEVVNGMVVDKRTKRVQLTDANDLSVVGRAYPDFTMSFINNLTVYKNLALSFQFDWYQGNDIYNMTRQWLYRDKLHKDFDVPVTIDGKPGAYVNYYNSLYNSVQRTGWFVEDGSFVRLRDLSLTYNLTGLIKREWLRNVSLTLAGRNLVTFTNYSGLDPEATSPQDSQGNLSTGVGAIKGVDYFGIPNLKSFVVGLNVEF